MTKAKALPDAYLAQFPADHRKSADAAYQDGFTDGHAAGMGDRAAHFMKPPAKSKRYPVRSQLVTSPVLSALVNAARSYADDLESGLEEGIYSDRADLDAVRAALEIVDPDYATRDELAAAKAAGYRVSKYGGRFYVYSPFDSFIIDSCERQGDGWQSAGIHYRRRLRDQAARS